MPVAFEEGEDPVADVLRQAQRPLCVASRLLEQRSGARGVGAARVARGEEAPGFCRRGIPGQRCDLSATRFVAIARGYHTDRRSHSAGKTSRRRAMWYG